MLRIYSYLATASGVLLLATLVLAAWLYNQQATSDLVELTGRHNIVIDRILSNAIWSRHRDFLEAANEMDATTLRSRPETAKIENAVRTITEGVQILKLKVYSRHRRTLYSTDPAEIGEEHSDSHALGLAINEGKPSSQLSYKDRLSAFSGELFGRDVVETYLPKFDEHGNVMSVFELYSDVTDAKQQIDRTTIRLMIGLTMIFLITYAVLVIGIMRRAIEPVRIASRRAAEIGPQASDIRLPTRGMPKEIVPLIVAINSALDRLDQALEAQRRFTADAAHELLTPLALIRAEIEDSSGDAVNATLLADIDEMAEMVRQMLELADLEALSGHHDISRTADLQAVAEELVSQLRPSAVAGRKELVLTGETQPLVAVGSPTLLKSVLRNLIKNALTHAPEHTAVDVHLDSHGVLRVSDRGKGVPPEDRTKIFERFWRGSRSVAEGAGLGLAIVKRIMDLLGGQIWVEDGPRGGACFVVRFVLADKKPVPEN